MTERSVSADLGFLHFQPQVVAFAGPLAHAGEHRVTAVGWRCGRSARSESPSCPGRPRRTGRLSRRGRTGSSRSTTLMPVSNTSVFGLRLASVGRLAVDRPAFFVLHFAATVDRFAQQVEHPAQRFFADRHRQRLPVSTTSMPRTMPSVEPSATHRTRLPPRCCWTSPVTLKCVP